MMTRRLALALPALLAGLAASAAPASPSAQPPEKPKITIAVGGQALFYYLPLTLADRLGYFKDEGLDVTIIDFAGGAKALQAMVGGSADLVSGSFEHTMHMQAKGIPVTGVSELVLEVVDLAAAEAFYAGALGLPVVERWPDREAIWVMAGDRTRIGLWRPQLP